MAEKKGMALPSVESLLANIYNFHSLWCTPYLCLKITGCNAHKFRNFSKDVCLLFDETTLESSKGGHCFYEIYRQCFLNIPVEVVESTETVNKAMHCLENFLKCCDEGKLHAECMKKMTTSEIKLKEADIQAVLAVHMFTPLLADGEVIADLVSYCSRDSKTDSSHKKVSDAVCPFCQDSVNVKNTNFGVKKLWHGRADIVIKNKKCLNVVKVTTDEIEEEEDGQGEPAPKRSRLEEELNWYSIAEVKNSDITELAVNQLLDEHMYTQAISQTIVNAFLALKLNKDLDNHLIPSFLVTGQCLLINFYNVKKDVLLVQSKPLYWFVDGMVSKEAVLFVWMALNYLEKDNLDGCIKSGFREFLLSSGVSQQYEKEIEFEFSSVQKPLKSTGRRDYFLDLNRSFQMANEFQGKYKNVKERKVLPN